MKPVTRAAQTIDATLEEVVVRLARNEIVDGVMVLGSTGTDAVTGSTDDDLLIVLTELSAPVRIVKTWIDHRFGESYCTTIAALDFTASMKCGSTPSPFAKFPGEAKNQPFDTGMRTTRRSSTFLERTSMNLIFIDGWTITSPWPSTASPRLGRSGRPVKRPSPLAQATERVCLGRPGERRRMQTISGMS